jgi:hypothetical protein
VLSPQLRELLGGKTAVQVNIRAGRFPAPEGNGTVYLEVPIDRLGSDG